MPEHERTTPRSRHEGVIVTNNRAGPVLAIIGRHGLAEEVEKVVGRDASQRSLLKPQPDRILPALIYLDLPAEHGVFVGDSKSDVDGDHSAGLPVVGYANNPSKDQRLRDSGADAILTRNAR